MGTCLKLSLPMSFQRVEHLRREEMDWQDYVEFLDSVRQCEGFETTVRRITETANLVFYEIEERQISGMAK